MNSIFYYLSYLSVVLICTLNIRSRAENTNGAHLNYKGKYTKNVDKYEIVVPQRVNKNGNFISHIVSHRHSKRSTNDMEVVFFKIPIAGKDYLIELAPNKKLLSPGAVIETHSNNSDSANSYHYFGNGANENMKKMFQNINVKKLKNTECHFSGFVKGEKISRAALSTCYGLIKNGFYTIEPVAEHNPFNEDAFPHLLYESNVMGNSSLCTTGGDSFFLEDKIKRIRRKSSTTPSTPLHIETLIVMDKSLINYHNESDCENYVLTMFNMAFNLFHDASLGLIISPTIVRIIRLEVENVEMNLKINADAVKTLEYFQTWQYEINPGDDSHPNHHDIAILITRVNVCDSPTSCGLLGLSTVGKACDPKFSAILCEDNGLRLGFVIAHEIGHLLGADHDAFNSTSISLSVDEAKTVMNARITLNSQTWSKHSQAQIEAFFESGLGNCFLDEPEDHFYNVQDLLPGVMYNADFQCKHLLTSNARQCDRGSSCDSLNCYVPGYACILTFTPPADGTECGESMWCHNGKCLAVGQRPGAIDGNWGEWSPWSECSRTCGSGVSSSVRLCDKPLPSHGGKNCVGNRKRDIQCGEFNDWIFPEDGKKHTWKAYYKSEDNPCTLYCINEKKKVAALRPRVVDGTMCYRGIRDICIGGSCKNLPCDLHFESNAVEDVCGICHGDGTSCEFTEGTENFTNIHKVISKLIDVPSGTRNIRVEEITDTVAKIIVRDKDSKDIYIKGSNLGMYTVPGSQAWLGMLKKNQEALTIPGPITKPISIWIQKVENATVKWSMALPPTQQRKPEFAWDFLKWSPCSARCGPGTQKSEPSCMEEKAGLVENVFCMDLEMPQVKVRPCELKKCEPRWMVGDWKDYEKSNSPGKTRKRAVYCIKQMGEGEGENQIVSDSECPEPKPHDTEPCESRQKREDAEYDKPKFIPDTVEFGFHKKYDDYLTHFAALSTPQRKSETVPLHLLSSPHFKHYFRVLETPEDDSGENDMKAGFDSNSFSNAMVDYSNQNKVSPNFYKNTFSGNPIEISHVQSYFTSIKPRENALLKKSDENFGKIQDRRQAEKLQFSDVSKEKRISRLKIRMKKNWEPMHAHRFSRVTPRVENRKESDFLDGFWSHRKEKNFNKRVKNPSVASSANFQCKRSKRLRYECKCPNRRCCKIRSKRVRHSLIRDIFCRKERKKFHSTPSDLEYLFKNFNEIDAKKKSRIMNLFGVERGNKTLTNAEEMGENRFKNASLNRENDAKLSSQNPNEIIKNNSDKFRQTIEIGEEHAQRTKTLRSMKKIMQGYDGSGIKKFNRSCCESKLLKNSHDESKKHLDSFENRKKTSEEKKTHSSSKGVSSVLSSKINSHSAKSKFKGEHKSLEDWISERKSKKLKPKALEKRMIITLKSPSRESVGEFPRSGCENKVDGRKIGKRSRRKWKKPKNKELAGKFKDGGPNNNYGTESRNYLNNLFRDSHSKMTPSGPGTAGQTEKPSIKIGKMVIDRDVVDNQRVQVVFQEDECEDLNVRYGENLPCPSPDRSIILYGQQVFDLYEKLQEKDERETQTVSLSSADVKKEKENESEALMNGSTTTTTAATITTTTPFDYLATNEREINESPDVDLIIENERDDSIESSKALTTELVYTVPGTEATTTKDIVESSRSNDQNDEY